MLAMTEEQFWQIIQRSFDACSGNIDEQADALAEELEPLSAEDLLAFDKIWDQMEDAAFTWELWGAAYIINGGCSEDGFCYFSRWLISRGQHWYETAVKNPDSLADYPEHLDDETEFEEIGYVAMDIYERKTSSIMPDHDLPNIEEPTGEPFDEEDDDEFQRRWPKLYQKYWEN